MVPALWAGTTGGAQRRPTVGDRRRLNRAAGFPGLPLLAILALAAFLRFWQLAAVGFNSDEAVYTGSSGVHRRQPHAGEHLPGVPGPPAAVPDPPVAGLAGACHGLDRPGGRRGVGVATVAPDFPARAGALRHRGRRWSPRYCSLSCPTT